MKNDLKSKTLKELVTYQIVLIFVLWFCAASSIVLAFVWFPLFVLGCLAGYWVANEMIMVLVEISSRKPETWKP